MVSIAKHANKVLYIISSPIGNVADVTYRAIETLKQVDVVLVEDTRITQRLFKHYGITTKMKVYNAFKEHNALFFAKTIFSNNNSVALLSDSGTPLISDPGIRLVNYCHKHNIRLVPIPGACALITALSVSGFASHHFFAGFLPNKKIKRKNTLLKILEREKKTIVLYESPHRFRHTIEILAEYNENMNLLIGRELTKTYEEITKKNVKNILDHIDTNIRGEFVVVVDNNN